LVFTGGVILHTDAEVVSEVLCKSLVSVVFCFILGSALYQSPLYNIHYPGFQIVIYGVLGSLFFYSLQINIRNAFAVLLVMFVLLSGLLTKSYRLGFLTRDALFVSAVGAAVYIYFESFYRRSLQFRRLHPLVLGTTFVLSFSVVTAIAELIGPSASGYSGKRLLWALQINATNGFVVGLGIGLGILVIDNGYVTLARILARRLVGSIGASFREFGERL
jgi:hypothetical protein